MHIISNCIILFMMILNILCEGEEYKNWNISFTPAEVTAVSGLCALISSTFSYPNTAKPKNLLLYQCKAENQCNVVTEKTKFMKCDLDKNKCNININNISAEDEGEYVIRGKGDQSYTYKTRFKIIIQDKPVINIPPLREGQEANLSCSAPAPCPKTPPEITWRMNLNEKSIKFKKITFTTSQGFYVATLTFMPSAKLHNATIECEVRYGEKIIRNSATIKLIFSPKDKDTTEHQDQSVNPTELQNVTGNNTGVSNMDQSYMFLKILELSTRILTFLAGFATSAVLFSVVLCCQEKHKRDTTYEVMDTKTETTVILEVYQEERPEKKWK